MAIIPEDKNWMWVLERPCPECGFQAAQATPATAASMVPELLPRWRAALGRAGAEERANPAKWSVLEYGAHVRDVFEVFTSRLELMLHEDNPTFANWDQDEAAVDGNYGELDPQEVAAELALNGLDAAAGFGALRPEQWERRGLRSDGAEFTAVTLSGYFLHDLLHHLHDVDA